MVNDGKQLIPLKVRHPDRFIELSTKGGSRKTIKKTKASMIRNSKKARCASCKLNCEFKEMCIKADPEARCAVPALRAAAKENQTGIINLSDDKIKMYMDELIELYRMHCLDAPSNETTPKKKERELMRRLNTFFHRVKEFKEMWAPPVQKSVSVNVVTNFDKMVERIKAYKEKEQIVVIGDET